MNDRIITWYNRQLRETMSGSNWLDESFQKKLENINDENAFLRPIEEIHSVAELIAHVLVWREESMKKLQGIPSRLTMDSPENWRNNQELKAIGWLKLKDDFFKSQGRLIELIEKMSDDNLRETEYAPGYSYRYLIEGLLHHDIYHLGQVGITIKLLNSRD